MVWHNIEMTFDPTRCPSCHAEMTVAKVEQRHRNDPEFERHVYRCENCSNISRFVVDRKAVTEHLAV